MTSYTSLLESRSIMNHTRWEAFVIFPNVRIFQLADISWSAWFNVPWKRITKQTTWTINPLHLIPASPSTSTWLRTMIVQEAIIRRNVSPLQWEQWAPISNYCLGIKDGSRYNCPFSFPSLQKRYGRPTLYSEHLLGTNRISVDYIVYQTKSLHCPFPLSSSSLPSRDFTILLISHSIIWLFRPTFLLGLVILIFFILFRSYFLTPSRWWTEKGDWQIATLWYPLGLSLEKCGSLRLWVPICHSFTGLPSVEFFSPPHIRNNTHIATGISDDFFWRGLLVTDVSCVLFSRLKTITPPKSSDGKSCGRNHDD